MPWNFRSSYYFRGPGNDNSASVPISPPLFQPLPPSLYKVFPPFSLHSLLPVHLIFFQDNPPSFPIGSQSTHFAPPLPVGICLIVVIAEYGGYGLLNIHRWDSVPVLPEPRLQEWHVPGGGPGSTHQYLKLLGLDDVGVEPWAILVPQECLFIVYKKSWNNKLSSLDIINSWNLQLSSGSKHKLHFCGLQEGTWS